MSIISAVRSAIASPEAREAERWATERLDNALASLVAGLERAWDRRGLRYHEMWLRSVYRVRHLTAQLPTSSGWSEHRLRRKLKRWERIELRRRFRAASAPPFQVSDDLWLTAADVMKALAE